MHLNIKNKIYRVLVFLYVTFSVSLAQAAVNPVSIYCPCEIERINETKAEVSLSIAIQPRTFLSNGSESGNLNLQIVGASQINIFGSSYYVLGEVDIPSIFFTDSAIESIKVDVPLNYVSSIQGFFSILLRDSSGSLMDQVNFLESSEEFINYGGSASSATSKLMVNEEVEFQYDDTTFSLNMPSISSTDKRSSNDFLTLRIAVANDEGSYYEAAVADILASYDENGESSISTSGDLNFSLVSESLP